MSWWREQVLLKVSSLTDKIRHMTSQVVSFWRHPAPSSSPAAPRGPTEDDSEPAAHGADDRITAEPVDRQKRQEGVKVPLRVRKNPEGAVSPCRRGFGSGSRDLRASPVSCPPQHPAGCLVGSGGGRRATSCQPAESRTSAGQRCR